MHMKKPIIPIHPGTSSTFLNVLQPLRMPLGGVVCMLARLTLVVLLCLHPLLLHAEEKGPKGTVRVGVFPFAPFNYLDEKGVAQGLNPDLLREIVRDEDWKVAFVAGSWAEGLERLQRQEIDLMLSVAYSPERGEIMDYTYESVAELWGQVFVRPEERSKNISDLAGQRVGVMRKDISGSNFIKTAEQLDVLCQIVEYASHGDVFAAVQKGEVEAGVAPQHFGLRHASEYNLAASTIMFSPFSIYFASKKGTQHELLSHIDAHLSRWKRNKKSFYYDRLNYWMSSAGSLWEIPPWLRYALLLTGIFALVFAGFTVSLKRAVTRKTRELQEGEQRYREIFNSTSEAILLLNIDTGALIDSNDTSLKIFGYGSKEELLAANIGGLSADIPPFTLKEGRKFLRQCIRDGAQVFEWLAKKQSKETFWVEVSLRKSKIGKNLKVLAVVRDISKRKQVEATLRESEDRYRSLFNSSPDGLMLTAPDGHIFSANESMCRLLGRTEAEIIQIGRSGIMDTSDPRLALALEERARNGQLKNVELTCVRQDGEKIPVELSSTVFQDKNGDTRTSTILHDITERKQAEAALQASLAEKDILLREVHHRVKNNMAAIIGLFDLQRQAMDDLHAQTILIELSSRVRAMSLVHEKLYRSESVSQIDFQDYIQSLLSHLRTSYGSPDVRCEVDAHGVALPLDLAVPCGMIINELITNTLKYAFPEKRSGASDEAAHLWIAMRQDHNRFTLSVADNGVGLPPGFDLNTPKTLGLSLVRMLGQHQLGGRYQVDQTRGLRFTLTFSIHHGMKTYEQRNHPHR